MLYLTNLDIENYKIFQDTEDYCFSQDSVLLSSLAEIGVKDKVLDLGTGTGVLSFLIAIKKHPAYILGVDVQSDAIETANKSLVLNNLQNKIKFVCADVKNFCDYSSYGEFDKVVCNPPYFNKPIPPDADKKKTISRFETTASLSDFISSASKALKNGGKLFMVHKCERLCDVICNLREFGLEPKHITFIKPKSEVVADTFIVCAKKGASIGLTLSELVVMDKDGAYSNTFKELYK